MDDIQFWVGSGSNQAAIVIDWNDAKTPESLIWGFRWDGVATGQTMLNAIEAADPRLTQTPGGGGPSTVYGLGFDTDSDGFSITGTGDAGTPTDADDHYKVGWFSAGFWSYWVNNNNQTTLPNQSGVGDAATRWSSSGGGFTTRTLSNNSWDGWSFAPGFTSTRPSPPDAVLVPEPSMLVGAVLILAGCALRRR
jgi:hypothetical protein